MRAGIYVRVSTQRQAQADGIAQQLERLQARARHFVSLQEYTAGSLPRQQ